MDRLSRAQFDATLDELVTQGMESVPLLDVRDCLREQLARVGKEIRKQRRRAALAETQEG